MRKLFILFFILGFSGERDLKKGSNLLIENDEILRVDCLDELCIDKKESHYTDMQINDLLLRRFSFEIESLDKLIIDNPKNETLFQKREKLLKYKEANLPKRVRAEILNKEDLEFRSYIFAATDSLD